MPEWNEDRIHTTGGLLMQADLRAITDTICSVFDCAPSDISHIEPLQKGLSNVVLSFRCRGGKYVYRHPGLGAEELINRAREAIIQRQVEEIGVDTTLVAMSVKHGWRISRFIENNGFDYHNINDVVRGVSLIRKLHTASCKVRYEFDPMEKLESIRDMTPPEQYGENFSQFPHFTEIKRDVYRLYELAKSDGIPQSFSHGDCRDENFLINENEIHLIDWEYAGYADPGFDIGTYICGGEHTREQVDQVLYIYFGRRPTASEKRHYYAYIAIAGFFYMHWTMYKESHGQEIGALKRLWYENASTYNKLALALYP